MSLLIPPLLSPLSVLSSFLLVSLDPHLASYRLRSVRATDIASDLFDAPTTLFLVVPVVFQTFPFLSLLCRYKYPARCYF